METIIILCLVLAIALLLHDKVVITVSKKRKQGYQKTKLPQADIMGVSRAIKSRSKASQQNKIKAQEMIIPPASLVIEYDEHENVPTDSIDLEDEQQELSSYELTSQDSGFAQGVTFEELSTLGMLLQENKLAPSKKETALNIACKIQGTELFDLLEDTIQREAHEITTLLNNQFSLTTNAEASLLENNKNDEFDIREFT